MKPQIHPDEYVLTISGSDTIPDEDLESYGYDEEVLLVVRARVRPPRYRERKSGLTEMVVLGVEETALVRSLELRKHLANTLNLSGHGSEPELEAPATPILDPVPVREVPAGLRQEQPGLTTNEPKFIDRDIDEDGPQVVGVVGSKDPVLASFLDQP